MSTEHSKRDSCSRQLRRRQRIGSRRISSSSPSSAPPSAPSPDSVAAVRAFNRFWTARIGVLDATLLETPFSLTQARVLYELNQVDHLDVAALLRTLTVDAGYLSRLLKGLAVRGLVDVIPAADDRRRRVASLTPAGRLAAADLDRRSVDQIGAMLAGLAPAELDRLAAAMSTIRHALDSDDAAGTHLPGTPTDLEVVASGVPARPSPSVARPDAADILPDDPSPRPMTSSPSPGVSLRDLCPGDLGWVIARHGAVYAQEYEWDMSFEALVASIVAGFASTYDPARERAWIADVDGRPAGCIFCVRSTDGDPDSAQLRLLLVEASARGLGVGSALVAACLAFARAAGYRRIVLWTNDVLTAARRIYEREGFTLISQEPHTSFGHDLVGQYWGRAL